MDECVRSPTGERDSSLPFFVKMKGIEVMPVPSADRDREATRYLPFVRRMARRLSAGVPDSGNREDLFQAGVAGLLEAMDRFDPEAGTAFSTFAAFRIRGAMVEELRRIDPLSRGERRRLRELGKAETELTARLGRPPEPAELAAEMDLPEPELDRFRQAAEIRLVGFEEIGIPPSEAREDLVETLMNAEKADALARIEIRELVSALARAAEALPEKEKTVLALYYQEELTMKEIGAVLDVSESRVSQLHSGAVRKLRDRLRREGRIGP